MGLYRYQKITERPKIFQCRIEPEHDSEINHFNLSELGVAWAVKYAKEVVLVVAKNGWKPSLSLLTFARGKNIRIIHLSLFSFNPDFLERLRILHFISTPLKKHPDRDKIVTRFIE
jgi:hypothetical protein